ncbi:unnamed protein product [Rotaria magnacalcarata]|uniref:5-formyltetrahydrofolate cyclo-ligase n=1 Tax=Rotaria magnacalcarata TaxID=392030 RepID=A0A815V9B6_9BILA|nr:unnamed protein product [Rotaria magnacalcarata]
MTIAAKQILRGKIRHMLKTMSNEDRIYQSNIVTNYLLHHPKYQSSRSISIYVNMNTEISTRNIIQHAFQSQKHVFIPRYCSKSMTMVRVYSLDDLDSLPMTKWNIRQPNLDDHTREIATNNIDLIIVPGLGFTLDGSRLGHGKGYYDRYLNSLNGNFYTIGLAFREQILEKNSIPMNSADIHLNESKLSKPCKQLYALIENDNYFWMILIKNHFAFKLYQRYVHEIFYNKKNSDYGLYRTDKDKEKSKKSFRENQGVHICITWLLNMLNGKDNSDGYLAYKSKFKSILPGIYEIICRIKLDKNEEYLTYYNESCSQDRHIEKSVQCYFYALADHGLDCECDEEKMNFEWFASNYLLHGNQNWFNQTMGEIKVFELSDIYFGFRIKYDYCYRNILFDYIQLNIVE